MVILTLNCGSSSAKYQVYDWKNKDVLANGVVEPAEQQRFLSVVQGLAGLEGGQRGQHAGGAGDRVEHDVAGQAGGGGWELWLWFGPGPRLVHSWPRWYS